MSSAKWQPFCPGGDEFWHGVAHSPGYNMDRELMMADTVRKES